MTSILSSISGKFSTSMVLGTFFPVVIFVVMARVLLVPLVPAPATAWTILAPLAALDETLELVVIFLASIILTGLLYNLNIPHIRFYEGYLWEATWLGRKRKAHYRKQIETLQAQQAGLPALIRALEHDLEALPENSPERQRLEENKAALKRQRGEVVRTLRNDYPKKDSVLPTRLGNIIRAFENYPQRQYNMSSITLWPRLIHAIDSRYATVIEEAKASFDFMLNAATLSGLLALLLALVGLAYPLPAASVQFWVAWLLPVLTFAVLAGWFYRQSIGRAAAWGNLVKGAFDLFRGPLLEQLGYRYTITSIAQERRLWNNISKRLIYGDPPKGSQKLLPYAPQTSSAPPTAATAASGARLAVTRGVGPARPNGTIPVTLHILNVDPKQPARTITVTDTVPDAFDYQWDSASASAGTLTVAGINPYQFHLETALNPQASLLLTYCILPRSSNRSYQILSFGRKS